MCNIGTGVKLCFGKGRARQVGDPSRKDGVVGITKVRGPVANVNAYVRRIYIQLPLPMMKHTERAMYLAKSQHAVSCMGTSALKPACH
jgi:hypothetical protein